MKRPLVAGIAVLLFFGVLITLNYFAGRDPGKQQEVVHKKPHSVTLPLPLNTLPPGGTPNVSGIVGPDATKPLTGPGNNQSNPTSSNSEIKYNINRKLKNGQVPTVNTTGGAGVAEKPNTSDAANTLPPVSASGDTGVAEKPNTSDAANTSLPASAAHKDAQLVLVEKKPIASDAKAIAKSKGARGPTFDIVRVNPRGNAVMAGRATPNATVTVKDGNKEVGKARANARGEWVVIPDQPLSEGSRELTLEANSDNQPISKSDKNLVIFVPDRTKIKPIQKNIGGALAVLVPRQGKGGSIVVQKPNEARRDKDRVGSEHSSSSATKSNLQVIPVSIDVVDYDEEGNVTISGRASPKSRLNVYIDNSIAASGGADLEGRWRVVPGGALAPGIYTLRVDHVSLDGAVIGRAEIQFARSKPVNAAPSDAITMVEPGNSLWRIARRIYGAGIQYSIIYAANRQQIRDPDLIYPGQVFFVPNVN